MKHLSAIQIISSRRENLEEHLANCQHSFIQTTRTVHFRATIQWLSHVYICELEFSIGVCFILGNARQQMSTIVGDYFCTSFPLRRFRTMVFWYFPVTKMLRSKFSFKLNGIKKFEKCLNNEIQSGIQTWLLIGI